MSEQETNRASQSDQAGPTEQAPARPATNPRRLYICALIIFLGAFGVRLLAFQDNALEALKVQSAVTEGYRHTGRLLRAGGLSSFFSPSSPLADPNHLGHPPGYSILLAALSNFTNDTDAAIRLLQILADALAAVVVFLIACALFSNTIAFIAGLLVALAPQFTYNSTLLLPDSLAVLPLLLSVYCLMQATKKGYRAALVWLALAGAFVGVSCWLRANAMMLAPFMTLVIPLLFERGSRLRSALTLVGGMLLVVAPLTVRNYIVYDHFIPISLGAGQTLLEGIADYDPAGRFGIPPTDMGIMKMEAESYGRPDYYGTLFNPDGVKRERLRIRRGLSVITAHPFWFAGVMVRRAASMLRLERVHTISKEPPVTHPLVIPEGTQPAWANTPSELLANGKPDSPHAEITLTTDGQMLNIRGDDAKYANQFSSAPFTVQRDTDYLLQLPVRIEQGRMTVKVVSMNRNAPYASVIIEPQDWKTAAEQTTLLIQIPFVSRSDEQLIVVFANSGAHALRPLVHIGRAELYALGPASYTWTRYPRALLNIVQQLFVTALMLPLSLFGLFLLIKGGQYKTLALLLVVPVYYFCFQSALHTEYRYVMAIHYLFFVFVALALHTVGGFLYATFRRKLTW